MEPVTTIPTVRSTPRNIERSNSLGFDTNACPEKRKERNRNNKSNFRYTPYSIPRTRHPLMLRSNSLQMSLDENNKFSNSKSTKQSCRSRKRQNPLDTERETSCQSDSDPFTAYEGETFYAKLIKENNLQEEKKMSMLEMETRMKKSLTIKSNENSQSSSPTQNVNQTDGESEMLNSSLDKDFKEAMSNNSHTIADDCNDLKCPKRDTKKVIHEDINEFDGFFLPSFDDEYLFSPKVFLQDNHNTEGERKSDEQYDTGSEFLDDESVAHELRKADTVLLFDDKENGYENEGDFDFSVPIFQSQPSCEGQKAKLSWCELFNGDSRESQNNDSDTDTDTDSIGREQDSRFNLDEILSTEWLERNPFLMMSSNLTPYNDLSLIQGTYCCTVCSTNLEVDPFKTVQHGDLFSLPTFNGSSNPRPRDCDVTLFCPSCCVDRLVYHADRL